MSSSKLDLAEKYDKELLDALNPYWCYNVDLLLVSLVVGPFGCMGAFGL
jgi:hypothetical protein